MSYGVLILRVNKIFNTVFDLITAHTLIGALSNNFVVFILQFGYFYLLLCKIICCWNSMNCPDKSRQFK